ncbi:MAG TPA: glycosyltransferase family A protein [Casimicrobiaceae bacterium]|nr:glycosyltransferase family A protein [Casimicrobiaceae bacterium]
MTPAAESTVVSVVIPAYNVAWCIRRAVDSVLGQDFRRCELIVVNDGSTDRTAEVLAAYGEKLRAIDQPNRGMSAARNAGIRSAGGMYIAFLDADDWWLPGKISRQVELMESRPEVGFCSTAARVEDGDGRLLNQWGCAQSNTNMLETLFARNAAIAGGCSAVMVRRGLFDRVGMFDETLGGFEDPDLWMRLAAVSGYACIDETLAVILRRERSVSRNLDSMRSAALRSMRKNRALLPASLRGGFWRDCLAGVYTDYAKPAYRAGRLGQAYADTLRALLLSPFGRGRLCLGLLRDFLLQRPM